MRPLNDQEAKIAVIGLGYVGLPLAAEFAKKQFSVIGFDINDSRIAELESGTDSTLELSSDELKEAGNLRYTTDPKVLGECNIYIITVPTPINKHKQPDLGALVSASRLVGGVISPGDIVIYESTVFPGATEERCIPEVEEISGLKFNVDFFAGYSPERINPGDKEHRLPDIKKVTSGSTPDAAEIVDELYGAIINAGTHKASSIRVAEAAKVIENTQRDLNIALINELAIIFNRLGIDTLEVLEAAGTKWNFLPFRPGLVGGHCIGVDPYYLTHKAKEVGYYPEVILAGRRINDGMGAYVTGQLIKKMIRSHINVDGARLLIMGLTFKENCPDLRNTRVTDIIDELKQFGVEVDIHDPWADPEQAKREYNLNLVSELEPNSYDAIIMAVAHDQYREMGASAVRELGRADHLIYDLKNIFDPTEVEFRL